MTKVLVIDECPEFRDFALRDLTRAGFEVIEARDGLAGLQRGVEESPDWILIDAGLPGLSGFEICRRFRDETATCRVPVMVWSSSIHDFDRTNAFAAGADAFIERSMRTPNLADQGWALLGRITAGWPVGSVFREGAIQ